MLKVQLVNNAVSPEEMGGKSTPAALEAVERRWVKGETPVKLGRDYGWVDEPGRRYRYIGLLNAGEQHGFMTAYDSRRDNIRKPLSERLGVDPSDPDYGERMSGYKRWKTASITPGTPEYRRTVGRAVEEYVDSSSTADSLPGKPVKGRLYVFKSADRFLITVGTRGLTPLERELKPINKTRFERIHSLVTDKGKAETVLEVGEMEEWVKRLGIRSGSTVLAVEPRDHNLLAALALSGVRVHAVDPRFGRANSASPEDTVDMSRLELLRHMHEQAIVVNGGRLELASSNAAGAELGSADAILLDGLAGKPEASSKTIEALMFVRDGGRALVPEELEEALQKYKPPKWGLTAKGGVPAGDGKKALVYEVRKG